MKRGDIVEFTVDCSAILVNCGRDVDVRKNTSALIMSLYSDNGMWSDSDPCEYESPFPAARLFLIKERQIVDSVHIAALNVFVES